MGHNIEIKIAVHDFNAMKEKIEQTFQVTGEIIYQEDRFYACTSGRLKLRIFEDQTAELIHYHRVDKAKLRSSLYQRTTIADPVGLDKILQNSLGTIGTVKKKRTLFLVGQTRIQLDLVEKLGPFLELEVVLYPNQEPHQGKEIAETILQKLGISEKNFCSHAYIDLL